MANAVHPNPLIDSSPGSELTFLETIDQAIAPSNLDAFTSMHEIHNSVAGEQPLMIKATWEDNCSEKSYQSGPGLQGTEVELYEYWFRGSYPPRNFTTTVGVCVCAASDS